MEIFYKFFVAFSDYLNFADALLAQSSFFYTKGMNHTILCVKSISAYDNDIFDQIMLYYSDLFMQKNGQKMSINGQSQVLFYLLWPNKLWPSFGLQYHSWGSFRGICSCSGTSQQSRWSLFFILKSQWEIWLQIFYFLQISWA